MTQWTWTAAKNLANQRKHGLSFEKAREVFDDPLALSRIDHEPSEERWQTIGAVEGVVIVVIHTWQDADNGDEEGRIISARRATRTEEKEYEEGEF